MLAGVLNRCYMRLVQDRAPAGELAAPVREPAFAFVLGLLDLGPVCNTELNACHLHRYILLVENLRLRRAPNAPIAAAYRFKAARIRARW